MIVLGVDIYCIKVGKKKKSSRKRYIHITYTQPTPSEGSTYPQTVYTSSPRFWASGTGGKKKMQFFSPGYPPPPPWAQKTGTGGENNGPVYVFMLGKKEKHAGDIAYASINTPHTKWRILVHFLVGRDGCGFLCARKRTVYISSKNALTTKKPGVPRQTE